MVRNRPRWPSFERTVWFEACCGVLILAGCQRNAYQAPPPKVQVTTPEQRTIKVYHQYTGTTQAAELAQLQARVTGSLQKILFKDGINVDENQLLFVIDPRPYQALVDQAKADLQSKQAVSIQQESIYKRTLVLLPSAAITQEQADVDRGNWLVAKAGVAQSEANLRQAELNLAYCEIRAPFAGRIGRRIVDIGNLVTTNATTLASVAKYDPMYVYFNASEADYLNFLERQKKGGEAAGGGIVESSASQAAAEGTKPPDYPVELGLSSEDGYPHQGTIDFLDNTVDPQSATILVRGVFKNPPPYYLVPGLFARLRVPIEEAPDSVLVPDKALGVDQAGSYLLVVDSDNKVEQRHVKIGEQLDDKRVITSGLKPNEWFIVEGLQKARPGEQVTVMDAPAAAENAGKNATKNTAEKDPAKSTSK